MLFLVFVLVSVFGDGHCLRCYHCHQTTSSCITPYKNSILTKECATGEVCFYYKYATKMPDSLVLATDRGCVKNITTSEACNLIGREKIQNATKHEKLSCRLCSYNLCNSSASKNFIGWLHVVITIVIWIYCYI
ncbi:uncharacterized protein LOC109594629 [Aethina tumida]|uniref:uncharacterized protein LOC109594629 n=1 Tax=Aethina tumida TaxID=116153 RepID=UPI00096B3D19|nr:uncharacterized protein LOC109594629 [Aethina tumida]